MWCQGPPASTPQTCSGKANLGITLRHHRLQGRQTSHLQSHVLKYVCTTPAPGKDTPRIFPWVAVYTMFEAAIVPEEKMVEETYFHVQESFQLVWLLSKKVHSHHQVGHGNSVWKIML